MKFAVIEGLDGSGKSTQIGLLKNNLAAKNIPFEFLHFPRTGSPFYGELISRFLRGEFGANEAVNPYLVALLYAGDRKDAAPEILKWLEEKKLVIADRYVISNIAYQCAKLKTKNERDELKKWILNFEYSYNKIPIPDINIFLDVPFKFTIQQLKQDRSGADRKYLQGNSDIHETDVNFQSKVREMYIELSKTESSLKMISCSENNMIMEPSKIFELLIDCLKKENILE